MAEQLEYGDWLTTADVARILAVTPRRVRQLAERGFLPFERISPRRMRFRRAQIEVIANARDARWWRERLRAQQTAESLKRRGRAPRREHLQLLD